VFFVTNVGGEKFNKAPRGFVAGARNQNRETVKAGAGEFSTSDWSDVERHSWRG